MTEPSVGYHLKNSRGDIALVGDKIRRNPERKDTMPLECVITNIHLINCVFSVTLDEAYNVPLRYLGDFDLVEPTRQNQRKQTSVSNLLEAATGDVKKPNK